MAYETKPDTGSLFRNDKRTQDTHAHARGSALIDGVEYWVDAWTNVAKNGDKYQSLKFKRKDKQAQASKPQQSYREQSSGSYGEQPGDLNDDLPF